MPKLKSTPLLIFFGGAAAVATAITSPQFVGAPLAFVGGALAGASVVDKRKSAKDTQKEIATRVSGAFSALYENNRGLVDPVELSFVANVSVEQAHSFLMALAETTNGQKIPTQSGVGTAFVFPHSNNVLDELSSNAKNWAEQQTASLTQQLEQHRQALRAAALAQAAGPQQVTRQQQEDYWKE